MWMGDRGCVKVVVKVVEGVAEGYDGYGRAEFQKTLHPISSL